MATKTIVTIPNPILSSKTQIVTAIDDDIKKLAGDLKDTLEHAKEPEGAGLAANQIGVGQRVCIVRRFVPVNNLDKFRTEDMVLINPKILSKSDEIDTDWEGCLSVPDVYGKVPRYKKIKVRAQILSGEEIQINASGFFARVIQHEIDHLDGILFTTRVTGKKITEKELDEILVKENL